jgi:hypothetical protein
MTDFSAISFEPSGYDVSVYIDLLLLLLFLLIPLGTQGICETLYFTSIL